MNRAGLTTAVLLAGGCAHRETAVLAERVARLEREVAALRASASAVHMSSAASVGPSASCAQVLDASVPPGTDFPYAIAVDRGETSLHDGDALTITEVRGTRPTLEPGGLYRVRGTYTLGSVDEATLAFSVTAVRPGEGCTRNNGRDHVNARRGSGTFELTTAMRYEGHPHLAFYVQGRGAGGVYFAAGDTVQR